MFEDVFGDNRYGEKEKSHEIMRLREENRKLREAVVKERSKCLAFEKEFSQYTVILSNTDLMQAESELRAEGVIE